MDQDQLFNSKITPIQYRAYKYRYVNLFLYLLCVTLGYTTIPAAATIQTNLIDTFHQDTLIVNFGSTLLGFLVGVPASFIGGYLIDKYSLKVGLNIGLPLMLVAYSLRLLCVYSPYFFYAGQGLAQFGLKLYLAPQKLSATWFLPSERTMATTIMTLGLMAGGAIGTIIPSHFVKRQSKGEEAMSELQDMNIFFLILASIIAFLTLAFFKDKPPTPPSQELRNIVW